MTGARDGIIASGLNNLLDFLYPSYCLVCDSALEEGWNLVCSSCWNKATAMSRVFCLTCGNEINEGLHCSHCPKNTAFPIASLGYYIDPLKEIIHRFKYYGYHSLAGLLADGLLQKYAKFLDKGEFDALIPIPLDSYREKKRGFNQAALLADIMGERLKIPVARDFIVKARKTRDQTRLDTLKRAENMKGAFRIGEGVSEGKRLILVDDVYTTGATLREAYEVLSAAGSSPRLALVIAVTE